MTHRAGTCGTVSALPEADLEREDHHHKLSTKSGNSMPAMFARRPAITGDSLDIDFLEDTKGPHICPALL